MSSQPYRVELALRQLAVPVTLFHDTPDEAEAIVTLEVQAYALRERWEQLLKPENGDPDGQLLAALIDDTATLMLLADQQTLPQQVAFLHYVTNGQLDNNPEQYQVQGKPFIEGLGAAFASRVQGDDVRSAVHGIIVRAMCKKAGLTKDHLDFLLHYAEYRHDLSEEPEAANDPCNEPVALSPHYADVIGNYLFNTLYYANRHGVIVRHADPTGKTNADEVQDKAFDALLYWLVGDVGKMQAAMAQYHKRYHQPISVAHDAGTLRKDTRLYPLFGFRDATEFKQASFEERYMRLKHAWQELVPLYFGGHDDYAEGRLHKDELKAHPVIAPLYRMINDTVETFIGHHTKEIKRLSKEASQDGLSADRAQEIAEELHEHRQQRSYWKFMAKAGLRTGTIRDKHKIADGPIIADSKGEAELFQLLDYLHNGEVIGYGDIRAMPEGAVLMHAMYNKSMDVGVALPRSDDASPDYLFLEYHPYAFDRGPHETVEQTALAQIVRKQARIAKHDDMQQRDYYMVSGTKADPMLTMVQALELALEQQDERITEALFPLHMVEALEHRIRQSVWRLRLPVDVTEALLADMQEGIYSVETLERVFQDIQRASDEPRSVKDEAPIKVSYSEAQIEQAAKESALQETDNKQEFAKSIIAQLNDEQVYAPDADALRDIQHLITIRTHMQHLHGLIYGEGAVLGMDGWQQQILGALEPMRQIAREEIAQRNEAFRHWHYEEDFPHAITEAGGVDGDVLTEAALERARKVRQQGV